MRTLLWLAFVGGVAFQVCGADVIEGRQGKPKKGCVTGPPKDCGIKGHKLKCRQILKEPEDGGEECPPEIEPEDPNKPENLGHQCYVGSWSGCGPLPGHPNIMVRTRVPIDLTADLTTCPPMIELCPGTGPQDCVMTEWSPWYTYGAANEIKLRVRFILIPPGNGGAACPHEIEGCIYGPWSAWQSYVGGCYRYRTGTGYPLGTLCPAEYGNKNPPCFDACLPLGPWSLWAHVSTNPCMDQRYRTQGVCAPEIQTRTCGCPSTPWTDWMLNTLTPCTQIRSRHGPPCPPGVHNETRPCMASCPPEPPEAVAAQGVLEERSNSRRKRDDPHCPEEIWIIYGSSDGCMAVQNVTWYKCIFELCQICIPPPVFICLPDKFTTLIIPLICPGGKTTLMTVIRPMACICYLLVQSHCDKFNGHCG